jgi:hypothetical protein
MINDGVIRISAVAPQAFGLTTIADIWMEVDLIAYWKSQGSWLSLTAVMSPADRGSDVSIQIVAKIPLKSISLSLKWSESPCSKTTLQSCHDLKMLSVAYPGKDRARDY